MSSQDGWMLAAPENHRDREARIPPARRAMAAHARTILAGRTGVNLVGPAMQSKREFAASFTS
jgi:hypothetical protein